MKPSEPTVALVERWLSGDTRAGDELWRRYHCHLENLARRLFPRPLRRRLDAEDLVQEAWAVTCEHLARFDCRGTGAFRSWLFSILERRVWNLWRHETAQMRDINRDRPLEGPTPVAQQSTPSETLSRKESEEDLRAAIAALNPHQRRVVEARYFEGKNWDEIAQEFQRSKAAVQMLLFRALQGIERLLN